jgi:hypothetical protein
MLHLTRRFLQKLRSAFTLAPDKYDAEASFWRVEISRCVAWYKGENCAK